MTYAIAEMYRINNELERLHSDNKNSHDDIYDSVFTLIQMENSCL